MRFVAEATAYLSNTRADAAAATVGTATEASQLRGGGGQVFDPQGKRASMLGGLSSGAQWIPQMAGFYELRASGRSEYIAVNVDPRESRLARWDDEARQRWLALQDLERTATNPSQAATPAGERLFPLWFWLLFGAAILAFMEPLLANYYLNVRRERSV